VDRILYLRPGNVTILGGNVEELCTIEYLIEAIEAEMYYINITYFIKLFNRPNLFFTKKCLFKINKLRLLISFDFKLINVEY
jgi:hypothetical protein